QHALGAIKEVRVFGRERYFGDLLARDEAARTRVSVEHAALESLPRLFTETAFVLGLVGLVAVVELRGQPTTAVLPFIGLYAYVGFRLIPAAHRLSLQAGNIRYEIAATETLCADVEAVTALAPHGMSGSDAAVADLPFRERLRLEAVSYSYERGGPPILREVNFEVGRGECLPP